MCIISFRFRKASLFLVGILFVLSGTGCTIALNIANPVTADFQYDSQASAPFTIALIDNRKTGDKFFFGKMGVQKDPVHLTNVTNELAFLAETLETELKARGLNAQVSAAKEIQNGQMVFEIDQFIMKYRQPTGYNPFSVFTSFAGTVRSGEKGTRIISYYVTGRGTGLRPKTAMSLTVEESFEILAKDIVSKMNRDFFSLSVNKSFIDSLTTTAQKEDPPTCRAILDIAFTKSPHAIPFLNSLNEEIESGRIKSCIIAALGFHGDPSFLPALKKLAAENTRKELLLALGAIGNVGTPDAIEFLRSQKSDDPGGYAELANEIISLYAGDRQESGR